jgi:dihydrodipicolinate synthase/N-acetylneuraminate lyase
VAAAELDGIWALGAGGETINLSPKQYAAALDVHLTVCAEESIALAVGVPPVATELARRAITSLSQLPVALLHVTEPVGYRYTAAEHLRHFLACADAAAQPVVAYVHGDLWRQAVANDARVLKLFADLVTHPNIVGVKLSVTDFRLFALLTAAANDLSTSMMTASGRLLLAALACGAAGGIFDDATIIPKPYAALWAAWAARDTGEAYALHSMILRLGEAISRVDHVGAKYALSLLDLCPPQPTPPFKRLTQSDRAAIAQAVQTLPPGCV